MSGVHNSRVKFICDTNGSITDFYDVGTKRLGQGSFGTVTKGLNKSSGSVRAIKAVNKAELSQKALHRLLSEIGIMKVLDHPKIIKLYETIEGDGQIYMVMELCEGGELFDRIIENKRFGEHQAALMMRQMISAVNYLHCSDICHRDLKPENFIFASNDAIETAHLKLIDFGLSCRCKDTDVLTTLAGTYFYMAPEVFRRWYNKASDVWSIGVIMYVMLSGVPPFAGATDAETQAKVLAGEFSFLPKDWARVSSAAKQLIRLMLTYEAPDRITAAKVHDHSWLHNHDNATADPAAGFCLVDNLRSFRSRNVFCKAVLQAIAQELSEERARACQDVFQSLDQNGDGKISEEELKAALTQAGVKIAQDDIHNLMTELQGEENGSLDYSEFLAVAMPKAAYCEEDVCWSAFCLFDRNGDGKIEPAEVMEVVNANEEVMTARDLEELFAEVDGDGDGTINFAEFMEMVQGLRSCSPKRMSKSGNNGFPGLGETVTPRTRSPIQLRREEVK
eukprot:TRINITY_DN43461_c0_g1_i2.p1 TRINITY_DN43461_c0_g1~~TRINITY_DN43461_c0_g1_i2.p1  ORF type:complete len:506 (+),score=106.23 TRINITY_DN43461_c0_g1_i2:274-1791(+)